MGRMVIFGTFLVFGGWISLPFAMGSEPIIFMHEAHLDQEFDLKFREVAFIKEEELTVALKSVNNSLCPEGVICVWAGTFVVTVEISKSAAVPMLIRFPNSGDGKDSNSNEYLGYIVRFVLFEGCPAVGEITASDTCTVRLVVTRKA
jgi:hypothetical protein